MISMPAIPTGGAKKHTSFMRGLRRAARHAWKAHPARPSDRRIRWRFRFETTATSCGAMRLPLRPAGEGLKALEVIAAAKQGAVSGRLVQIAPETTGIAPDAPG